MTLLPLQPAKGQLLPQFHQRVYSMSAQRVSAWVEVRLKCPHDSAANLCTASSELPLLSSR
jgi:hypothetical protein